MSLYLGETHIPGVTIPGDVNYYNPLYYATDLSGTFYKTDIEQGSVLDIKTKNCSDYSDMLFSANAPELSVKLQTAERIQTPFCISKVIAETMTKKIDFSGVVGHEQNPSVNILYSPFRGCKYLEEVIGNINATGAYHEFAAFDKCYSLREVRFVPGSISESIQFTHCVNLSNKSVQSIIDGLADLTGTNAKTLSLSNTILLSEQQKAQITSKNWNLSISQIQKLGFFVGNSSIQRFSPSEATELGDGFIIDYAALYDHYPDSLCFHKIVVIDEQLPMSTDNVCEFDINVSNESYGYFRVAFDPRATNDVNLEGIDIETFDRFLYINGDSYGELPNMSGINFQYNKDYHIKVVTKGLDMELFVNDILATKYTLSKKLENRPFGWAIWGSSAAQQAKKKVSIKHINYTEL